jgi:KTSC domain
MNIAPLDSSLLASAAYDPQRRLLCVEFRSRAVYVYGSVPSAVHDALLNASSKGGYFNRCIRGQFPFCRLVDGRAQ